MEESWSACDRASQAGSRDLEVRLRLVELVPHITRIDAHQKLPLLG
jgi:hypothetical protein